MNLVKKTEDTDVTEKRYSKNSQCQTEQQEKTKQEETTINKETIFRKTKFGQFDSHKTLKNGDKTFSLLIRNFIDFSNELIFIAYDSLIDFSSEWIL